jgi:hypothetical protein
MPVTVWRVPRVRLSLRGERVDPAVARGCPRALVLFASEVNHMVTPIVTEIRRDTTNRERELPAHVEHARKAVHVRQVEAVRQALMRGVDTKPDRR